MFFIRSLSPAKKVERGNALTLMSNIRVKIVDNSLT